MGLLLSTVCVSLVCCLFSCYGKISSADATIPAARTEALDKPECWTDRTLLLKYIRDQLEVENRRDIGCCGVLLNRPWLREGGAEVKAPKFSPNEEWLDGKPFPNGVTDTENM